MALSMRFKIRNRNGSAVSLQKGLDQALEEIRAESQEELDDNIDTFVNELRSHTPIDKGRAKRGWKKKGQFKLSKRKTETPIVDNRVEYIAPLENGHSDQAPDGMIEPAFKKAFNNRSRRTRR